MQTWPDLCVTVNVSAVELCATGCPQRIIDIAHSHAIDPSRITLEITETFLIEDPQVARQQIETLCVAGFHLALDDFGSGFASISYLTTYPFRYLKIDRSFVRDLGTSPEATEIFNSIVWLGQAFSLTVMAEGVETNSQTAIVKKSACDLQQGYVHARPMTFQKSGRAVSGDRK